MPAIVRKIENVFLNRILTAERPQENVLLIDRFACVNSLSTNPIYMI